MKSDSRPVVLVTGCGSGVGLALATILHEQTQFRVVITARKSSDVMALKQYLPERSDFVVRKLDITNKSERDNLIASIYSDWRAIDVLVNNAGVSYRSVVEHMDDQSEQHQLEVNYLGPMALIRLVVPGMREKGKGKIINVSSVSGMVAMPTMASYSASKHALEGASEALWYELKPFGIDISLVQPGFINSNSFEKVCYSKKAELSAQLDGPYADYYQNMGPFIARLMRFSTSTAEDVARKIFNTCQRKNPPLWISATLDATFFFLFRKLIPRKFFHRITQWMLPNRKNWGGRFRKNKTDYKSLKTAL